MSIDAHTDQFKSLHIQAQMSGHSEWLTDCYLALLPLWVNEMTCAHIEQNMGENPDITTVYDTA